MSKRRFHQCNACRSRGRVSLPLLAALVLATALLVRIAVAVSEWRGLEDSDIAVATLPAQQDAPVTDVAAVQSLGLFGEGVTPAPMPRMVGAAAISGLDLRLDGVAVAAVAADSVAIIAGNGSVNSYRVGDTLPVGVNVVLVEVASDHVVLDNNGTALALGLYDSTRRKAAMVSNTAAAAPAGGYSVAAAASANTDGQTLQQRTQAAARLAEIIEVSPAAADGALIGYRLAPGARLKDFVQLGFRDNDIVTAVNGIALTDVSNLPELYRLMNEPGDVSFLLLRDGQPLTLEMTLAP